MDSRLVVYPAFGWSPQWDTLSRACDEKTHARRGRVVYVKGVRTPSTVLIAAAALLGGCGAAESSDAALGYPATAISSLGTFAFEATVDGDEPIVRGVHSVTLRVEPLVAGVSAEGLVLTVQPWMPAMGHGSPYDGAVLEVGEGTYRAHDVSLFMAGRWELRTTVEPGGERATLSFDVR